MLYWNAKGEIASRKLYQFNSTPTEEGKDITLSNPQKADELQKRLLNYLKSVNAKTVKSGKKPIRDD
jgi:hypothetical protein